MDLSKLLVVISNIALKGRHVNENIVSGWVNGLVHWKLLKPIGRPRILGLDVNKDREEGQYVTYDLKDFAGWDKLSFCTDEGPHMGAAMRRLPATAKITAIVFCTDVSSLLREPSTLLLVLKM